MMKLFRPFLVLSAYVIFQCASTHEEKEFYSPSQPKYVVQIDAQGLKNGPETWWYPSGELKYQAHNLAGQRDGKFTARYADGKLWYEGFEYHGKPESTLTYWHPNGRVKSVAIFRDGIQLERKDFDEDGKRLESRLVQERIVAPSGGDEASAAEGIRLRKAGLQIWAMRVRQTVESYWVLPKQFGKERPYRAVAKIRVGRNGKILGVSWSEKSPNAAFNSLAQNTFKRIKKLPAFPPQVRDESLEIQYEFISLGKPSPRHKLETRQPDTGDNMDKGGVESRTLLPPGPP